jgi:methyltransferase (TIGR00027 family)
VGLVRSFATKREISVTAETTAWLRAVGAREPDRLLRNPDRLAHELIDPRLRALRRVPGAWRLVLRAWERYAPGYYEYETARTKCLDAVLEDRLAAGIEQVVLVGSGYDSRFHRFADRLAGVRAFEVDRPGMLRRKRRRATRRRLAGAPAIQVPLDLNLETPLRSLIGHGYDPAARTLFLCSGVMMYLDPPAVDRLLRFVAEEAGAGSSICFDYVYASALRDPASYHGAERMVRNVDRVGESYRFTIDPPDLPALVARNGLRLIADAGPEQLERDYVTRSDGSLRGRICGYLGIAHAG